MNGFGSMPTKRRHPTDCEFARSSPNRSHQLMLNKQRTIRFRKKSSTQWMVVSLTERLKRAVKREQLSESNSMNAAFGEYFGTSRVPIQSSGLSAYSIVWSPYMDFIHTAAALHSIKCTQHRKLKAQTLQRTLAKRQSKYTACLMQSLYNIQRITYSVYTDRSVSHTFFKAI